MPIELREDVAVFTGVCEVSEAEPLLSWLQAHPHAPVDLGACEHVHTAVLQVLMASRCTIAGAAQEDPARPWLGVLPGAAGGFAAGVGATGAQAGEATGAGRPVRAAAADGGQGE
jgi:hypothetical protein